MNQQLDLVLHTYDLELTIDEQTQIQDTICYYCDSNQSWMEEDEEGIKEEEIANQILDLPFSSHQTKVIKFTDKQMDVLISAMSEYQDLWRYGDDEGVRLGIVNEDGSLAGILGDIDSKIEEVM